MPQAGRTASNVGVESNRQKVSGRRESERKNSPKFIERSWNVYENKGPSWKLWEGSWNVFENKGA
jgi:hypothetical protein